MPKYFSHTLGAFRALFEAHLPLQVLSEYDLENAELQGIRVLVLPDVRVLSDRSSEVTRRFVKAGGGLLATGDTGLFDHTLQSRPNFSLADLFHTDYVSTREMATRDESIGLWLAAPDHPIVNDDVIKGQEATAWRNPSGPPAERGALDVVCSLTTVRARDGAQTVISLNREPGRAAEAPALLASTYGAGRVVYSAAGLDQAMFYYPNAFIGQILLNAVKWVAADRQAPS
jgi:hypothetical protein